MDINEIQESVSALHDMYQSTPQRKRLRDRVLVEFFKQTLSQLKRILRKWSEGEGSLAEPFERFFRHYWTLANGTSLSPTSIPKADITRLFCEIADIVVHEKNMYLATRSAPSMAIQLLMPTISIESFHDGYPNLCSTGNLQTVLETHVLGFNGLYLLPVKLLTELNLSAESTRLPNPYYDYKLHPPESAFVNHEEYERLVGHSSLTRALSDAKNDYDRLTSDTSNLLGQLKQLCQKLYVNSANGAGSENYARDDVYSAIITFMEYYNQLEGTARRQIPELINAEIVALLRLTTDATINVNATENMETCIATRRNKLIECMMGHDSELIWISVSGSIKGLFIDDARIRFETAKAELSRAIALNRYSKGRDNLGLHPRVFDTLRLPFAICSLNNLGIFQELTASEIVDFLGRTTLRRQIIQHITSIDILYSFVVGLAPEKLKVFLKAMADELTNHLIKSHSDLTDFLILLRLEKCQIVCDALSDKLKSIIKSAPDFSNVLRRLSPEQRMVVFESIKTMLPEVIKSATDFFDVLNPLSLEQRVAVYEIMKDKLPGMMNSIDDCRMVLHFLSYGPQLAFENLLVFVGRMHLSDNARAFALVLVGQDNEKMKAQFDVFVKQAHRPKGGFFAFFKRQKPFAELIASLSCLSPTWINKINIALDLNLEAIQLGSQRAIKAALATYINAQDRLVMHPRGR